MDRASSLPDLLAEAGIRLKGFHTGRTQHVVCPRCSGGKTREVSLSVTLDDDGMGARWICHRGSCGWTDGGRVGSGQPDRGRAVTPFQAPPPAPPKPVVPHSAATMASRPPWLHRFFDKRNIGPRTVEAFGIYAAERTFPQIGTKPCIVFPYLLDGVVVNRKYRPYPDKNPMMQEPGALQTLFNVDRISGVDEAVVCEGEIDCMALYECGFAHSVTLKDGAPATVNASNEKRFEALRTHESLIGRVKRFILAGDMDGPGLALREELARRLGRHRCYLVTWPDGCKDACDVLQQHGPDAVRAAISMAEPYPIKGVQRIKAGTLTTLRNTLPPSTMTTGTRATDAKFSLATEGRLIVVTGFPSSGKSTWTRFVMIKTAIDHDRRWAVFSPEMEPWEHFVAECAEVYSGKPFWRSAGSMTDDDVAEAETWLGDHVTMIVCDSEEESPTLDWLLERATACVLRDGTTDLLIDPWNEVEHVRGKDSETDYIGLMLRRLKAFAKRHGCNVWIIAHPAKPLPLRPGEKRAAPGPYDLAGSANWANKTDIGITVHSPEPGAAEIHLWKLRFRRWGQRGAVVKLDFDASTGRYSTPLNAPEPAEVEDDYHH